MATKNKDIESQIGETSYRITYEQLNTLISFLKLWSQLAMWTRSLVISTVGDLENKTSVVNQLFSIPTELYYAFRIFYGSSISQELLNLMTNFVSNEWRLIDALKEGNRDVVDQSTAGIYQTADEIAALLSRINVYWDQEQWRSLLYQYIRLLIDEMVASMAGEHEREIEIYKRLEETAELIGSYMARGIIARSAGLGSEILNQL